MNRGYTEEQWKEELEHPQTCLLCARIARFYSKLICENLGVNCLGTCLSCPECGSVGFYGARYEPNRDIKYRMCKFCGFRQEIGGGSHLCNMFVCEDCQLLRNGSLGCEVLKYDWNAGDSHKHFCKKEMTRTLRPAENEKHPQHKLKEMIAKL